MYKNRIKQLEESLKKFNQQLAILDESNADADQLKKKKLECSSELSRLRKLQFEHEHETIQWDDDR